VPEALSAALAAGRLDLLLPAALLAGLVRGFTGFGAALIFIPVAARVLAPAEAVAALLAMDFVATLPLLPAALRQGEGGATMRLAAGGVVGVPLGVWLLASADPTIFRWAASLLALGLLVLVASGLRFPARPGPRLQAFVGALSGLMGGFSGMSGPPVVLFQLGGSAAAGVIRANLILFFAAMSVLSALNLGLRGLLSREAVALGALLLPGYAAATLLGARLFRWRGDAFFRRAAYLVVGGAALSGLPLFGG
jgi:uncharacterized protein